MTIPDNYDAWVWHDREMEARARKLPTCERCGEPIYEMRAVYWRGMWFCDSCLEEMREDTTEDSY